MRTGRLFAVVGASGAGKDTLMEAAAARRPELVLARRVITRPADLGGEAFESVDEAGFAARLTRGEFALWWDAHGLRYAIPARLDGDLASGRTVLFNASRAVLAEAARRYPGLEVLHVTAPKRVLSARLAARGREEAEDIAARLERSDFALPAGLIVRRIVNDGTVAEGRDRLLAALQPERA